jgi:hypothetical protein
MANLSLTDDAFPLHNHFWFLTAYLVGLAQRISQLVDTIRQTSTSMGNHTNLRHSKLLLKILVTYVQQDKCNFPKSSNPRE